MPNFCLSCETLCWCTDATLIQLVHLLKGMDKDEDRGISVPS